MSVARSFAACVVALFLASCVTNLPRYHEPARVESIALAEDAGGDDLVVLEIVEGAVASTDYLLLVVPRPSDRARPIELHDGGKGRFLTDREELFLNHRTERWTAARRKEEDLALACDVPEERRREYVVRNVRHDDGHIDLVVSRTHAGGREELGTVRLPDEYVPPDVPTPLLWLAAPPLAAIDLAWIPITAASFVLLIPFGALSQLDLDSDAR